MVVVVISPLLPIAATVINVIIDIVQADVLVATTVIENGVDMPNVNTIIVLSADR